RESAQHQQRHPPHLHRKILRADGGRRDEHLRDGGLPGGREDHQARGTRMKRIALIEDDADIAFTIKLNLERDGYQVAHYASGQEGLLAVQQGEGDFVILDLNLPDLDGLTICRELRRDPSTKSIPILMLTARGSERDRITGLELGADDYLTKPFSMRELVARVGAIFRRTSHAL